MLQTQRVDDLWVLPTRCALFFYPVSLTLVQSKSPAQLSPVGHGGAQLLAQTTLKDAECDTLQLGSDFATPQTAEVRGSILTQKLRYGRQNHYRLRVQGY